MAVPEGVPAPPSTWHPLSQTPKGDDTNARKLLGCLTDTTRCNDNREGGGPMKEVDLERYVWEAEAHANELLELQEYERRIDLAEYLEGNWDKVLPCLLHPPKEAFVLLGEDPTPQDRRLSRLRMRSEAEADLLWLQARFLALRAASAMQRALRVQPAPRTRYRKAVRNAAEAVCAVPALPSPWETAMLELPR